MRNSDPAIQADCLAGVNDSSRLAVPIDWQPRACCSSDQESRSFRIVGTTRKETMTMAADVINLGENSPEYVALRLFREVAHAENKAIMGNGSRGSKPDKKLILDTYAECLETVRSPNARRSS
jgi:hypothetical protein